MKTISLEITKKINFDEIEKGTVIRTGYYRGAKQRTKAIDKTDETVEALHEHGWAVETGNDAPRGGVGGKYVKVIGKLWTKKTLSKHVKEVIETGEYIYRGCGVYRIAIADGKVVASIYGGYHDSYNTLHCTQEQWSQECERQLSKLGTVVKADGSGCSFFVREGYLAAAQEAGAEIKSYFVPSVYGGVHANHEIV